MEICSNCGKAIEKRVGLDDAWVHALNQCRACDPPVATPLVFHSLAEQRAIHGEI